MSTFFFVLVQQWIAKDRLLNGGVFLITYIYDLEKFLPENLILQNIQIQFLFFGMTLFCYICILRH